MIRGLGLGSVDCWTLLGDFELAGGFLVAIPKP